MKRVYVLDTNVIISSPEALRAFEEHDVVLPITVIEELDSLKKREGDVKANAIAALRYIDSIRNMGNITKGVVINDRGGTLTVYIPKAGAAADWPQAFPREKMDNQILMAALELARTRDNVVLVSQDTCVRVKASILGIQNENYRTGGVPYDSTLYSGRRDIYADSTVIDALYSNGRININESGFNLKEPLIENEYVTLIDLANPQHTGIGRVSDGCIVKLRYLDKQPFGVRPRNLGQKFLQEALMLSANEAPLVIIKGAAGTAKTFYSLAVGLQKVMEEHEYRKILLTRANVKFDADIGFLKGGEEEKIGPLIRFANDNLENLMGGRDESDELIQDKVAELFERGYITAEALAYMRGRSITNTYILIDEAQNLTPDQAKGIITRAGVGSKIILAGDPDQIDNPKLTYWYNGLAYAIDRMKGSPLCHIISFGDSECERSSLAIEAAQAMKSSK